MNAKQCAHIAVLLTLAAWLTLAACADPYQEAASTLRYLAPAGAAAILFDADGEIAVLEEGYADRERRRGFSAETRVAVGELSELFMAAASLRLAELGETDLDAPLGHRLGALAVDPESPAGIRLERSSAREILYHGTGIKAEYALMLRAYEPARDLGPLLSSAPVLRDSDAALIHAGALYDALGLLLASPYGETPGQLATRLVFGPLGMRSAVYGPVAGDARDAAHYKYGLPLARPEEPAAPSMSFAVSGRDLARFAMALLPAYDASGPRAISASAARDMLRSQSDALARDGSTPVGLPWRLDPPGLEHLGPGAWYAGKYVGHRACVVLLPEAGIGALAVTNAWAWDARESIYDACRALLARYAADHLGITEPPPPETPGERVPPDLAALIGGAYASELGPLSLRLDGEVLRIEFEGIEEELVYTGPAGFAASDAGAVRVVRPAGLDAIDVRFASGAFSPSSPRLERGRYPAEWARYLGAHRRITGPSSMPYAVELRLKAGVYLLSGGDGREYALVPTPDGAARIVCGAASVFNGKNVAFVRTGLLAIGGVEYGRSLP